VTEPIPAHIAEELERARREVARLEDELARATVARSTDEGEPAAARPELHHAVASARAEIDAIDAELARARSARAPDDREAAEEVGRATEAAEKSDARAAAVKPPSRRGPASGDLRTLFREAAQTIHPDYAEDEDDRRAREEAMRHVVAAHEEGDVDELSRLLDEWRELRTPTGRSDRAERDRLRREVDELRQRLRHIRAEVAGLTKPLPSDLTPSDLKAQAENVAREGREMLNQLRDQLRDAVESAELRRRRPPRE
jgi:hypothetical protein